MWRQGYMNEEDADETTRLMSDELPPRSYDEDETSRDYRHHRQRKNSENVYTVRLQRIHS